jgi:hypothetical protein
MRAIETLTMVNNVQCVQFRRKTVSDPYYLTIFNGSGCSAPVRREKFNQDIHFSLRSGWLVGYFQRHSTCFTVVWTVFDLHGLGYCSARVNSRPWYEIYEMMLIYDVCISLQRFVP